MQKKMFFGSEKPINLQILSLFFLFLLRNVKTIQLPPLCITQFLSVKCKFYECNCDKEKVLFYQKKKNYDIFMYILHSFIFEQFLVRMRTKNIELKFKLN